jgi:predicted lipid-binding transport protein (Tim44 family)
MNKWFAGLLIGVMAATACVDAEAQRRFGGGKSFGRQSPQVQRQATPPAQQPGAPQQAAPAGTAQQPATATAPAAGAPAAAARAASPWRGALMGLAAGLGLAALASWLGFSEALTMFLTVLLLGLAVMLVIGFVVRRMRGPQPVAAAGRVDPRGPGTYSHVGYETTPVPAQRAAVTLPTAGVRPGSAMDQFTRGNTTNVPWGVPAGFDTPAFLTHAKNSFVRLQHAWDSGNLDEMAELTTDDMFISLTHELRNRSGRTQTEVVALDAELLGIESSADEHVASVRFDGRLSVNGEIEQVTEVWNLIKPTSGRGGWLLAGIQQMA